MKDIIVGILAALWTTVMITLLAIIGLVFTLIGLATVLSPFIFIYLVLVST